MINNQLKQHKKKMGLWLRKKTYLKKKKIKSQLSFIGSSELWINQVFVYLSLLFYSNRFSYQINWIQIDLLAYSGLISLNSSLLFLRH